MRKRRHWWSDRDPRWADDALRPEAHGSRTYPDLEEIPSVDYLPSVDFFNRQNPTEMSQHSTEMFLGPAERSQQSAETSQNPADISTEDAPALQPLQSYARPSFPQRQQSPNPDLPAHTKVESEAKGIIANLQKTWVTATTAVRTSKRFVYALLALHNGYPDLMSKEHTSSFN